MAKIDLERFIRSLIGHSKGATCALINDALKDQGLEYKDGQIVKISKPFKIKAGQSYMCIKNLNDKYGTPAFIKGNIYKSTADGTLIPFNSNIPYDIVVADTYFRPATEESLNKVKNDIKTMKVFQIIPTMQNAHGIALVAANNKHEAISTYRKTFFGTYMYEEYDCCCKPISNLICNSNEPIKILDTIVV